MANTTAAPSELPPMRRFILYRTQAVGWQPVGWVLLSQQLPSADAGLKLPGCAWAEDDEGKYNYSDTYPIPAPSGGETAPPDQATTNQQPDSTAAH